MTGLNIVTAPRTATFQMRVNPEIKSELERLYASLGISLTDAVNMFFQQSLNCGGFPAPLSASAIEESARTRFMQELIKAYASSPTQADWLSEDEAFDGLDT